MCRHNRVHHTPVVKPNQLEMNERSREGSIPAQGAFCADQTAGSVTLYTSIISDGAALKRFTQRSARKRTTARLPGRTFSSPTATLPARPVSGRPPPWASYCAGRPPNTCPATAPATDASSSDGVVLRTSRWNGGAAAAATAGAATEPGSCVVGEGPRDGGCWCGWNVSEAPREPAHDNQNHVRLCSITSAEITAFFMLPRLGIRPIGFAELRYTPFTILFQTCPTPGC